MRTLASLIIPLLLFVTACAKPDPCVAELEEKISDLSTAQTLVKDDIDVLKVRADATGQVLGSEVRPHSASFTPDQSRNGSA